MERNSKHRHIAMSALTLMLSQCRPTRSGGRTCIMTRCSFKFCKSVKPHYPKNDGMSYFRFPKHLIRREKWIEVVRRQRDEPSFEPNTASLVCSNHFNKDDLYTTGKGARLRDTAVPFIDPMQLKTSNVDKGTGNNTTNETLPKPGTTKLLYQYTNKTKDSRENSEQFDKKMKIDTDLDVGPEGRDVTKFSNYENPFLPSTSYDSSDASDDNREEIGKIIKIEFEDSSDNSDEKNEFDSSVEDDDGNFVRTHDFDKFGEHVAGLLKRIPVKRALDLQPQIIKMITAVMNEDQTTIIKIVELYGDGN